GIARPRLALCGLNPHAGEGGLFGRDEEDVLAPALRAAAVAAGGDSACALAGPLPADTAFARALAGEFDAVVALYHDQAQIAVKLLDFAVAVNLTLGLPYVRTSVSHGVAYDLVGRNAANPRSLIEAVRLADRLAPVRARASLFGAIS
ncbi:MAG: 4-hydroxythreonine-4-phosphate dehydrogenase PdxA, partial [Planctomycetes bacterium]|nr:4-hydroxythreonine-4-phosphate dehydrogenase PdxA [Planctomycetota bacterium]